MKRLWIASALLVSLLVGSIINAQIIQSLSEGLSVQLKQAQEYAEENRWEDALHETETARQVWNDHNFYLHVVTRHGDTDQIQRGLETAVQLLERRSMAEYAHVNTDLIVQLDLLAQMELPTLSNIL